MKMSAALTDRIRALSLFLGLLLAAPLALAADGFPRPPELQHKVDFWRDIFVRYSSDQIVLHDRAHTSIVYKVLDFSDVVPLLDAEELYLYRRRIEDEEKQALNDVLLQVADNPDAANLSAEAVRVRELFRAHGKLSPEALRLAADTLRGQRGLRDKTMDALVRSGRYLPYMEQVFAEMGLPVLLTRLPIVESSFNTAAYSKSGAAGVWQFMPGTARRYMSYDEVSDDRRDPWLSTHAAAQHLRDDYELLQDWPMAVTAYNFGRYGIARGLAEIDGSSLVDLIERYDNPRWGFAAQNFYAEFLAAVDVEQNAVKYFGPLRRDDPELFEEVPVPYYARFDTLRRLSGQSDERFAELNPSFSVAVQRGDLLVPPGRTIRVPTSKSALYRFELARLDASERFTAQLDFFRQHRVRRGDTLSGLAQRYQTSVAQIRQTNGLNSRGFIRVGQTLKIPPAGTSRSRPPAVYTVKSGETLTGIAQRYRVSVASLQAINGIGRPELIRAGQRLKIPGDASAVASYHTIRAGQTIESIARHYGVSASALAQANELDDVNFIRVGQRLRVPGG